MPNSDRTGPRGKGPQTGRGYGDCSPSGNIRELKRGLGRGFGQGRRWFGRWCGRWSNGRGRNRRDR